MAWPNIHLIHPYQSGNESRHKGQRAGQSNLKLLPISLHLVNSHLKRKLYGEKQEEGEYRKDAEFEEKHTFNAKKILTSISTKNRLVVLTKLNVGEKKKKGIY